MAIHGLCDMDIGRLLNSVMAITPAQTGPAPHGSFPTVRAGRGQSRRALVRGAGGPSASQARAGTHRRAAPRQGSVGSRCRTGSASRPRCGLTQPHDVRPGRPHAERERLPAPSATAGPAEYGQRRRLHVRSPAAARTALRCPCAGTRRGPARRAPPGPGRDRPPEQAQRAAAATGVVPHARRHEPARAASREPISTSPATGSAMKCTTSWGQRGVERVRRRKGRVLGRARSRRRPKGGGRGPPRRTAGRVHRPRPRPAPAAPPAGGRGPRRRSRRPTAAHRHAEAPLRRRRPPRGGSPCCAAR